MLFREFFRLLKVGMLYVLLRTLLFFQLLSNIVKQKSQSNEDTSSDDDSVSTKSFRTNEVPKSTDGNTDLQAHCVAFSVLSVNVL